MLGWSPRALSYLGSDCAFLQQLVNATPRRSWDVYDQPSSESRYADGSL
jgi:hypothetical protein